MDPRAVTAGAGQRLRPISQSTNAVLWRSRSGGGGGPGIRAGSYPRSPNLHLFQKAAVAAGTTTDATWAGPLSVTKPLADAFLELLRPALLIGKIPGLRRVPFNVAIAAQTAGSVFGWLGEGAATAASEADFATVTMGRTKVAGLIVISRELAQLSSPSAIAVMTADLIAGCKQFLDGQFIDPAVAAIANTTPASITNGAGNSASAGATSANAATDFQTLVSAFVASNPSVEDLVILSTPANAIALSRALDQPTLGLKGGTAFGVPIVTSNSVGARLVALDASQVLIADDNEFEVAVSNSASVQMDGAPSEPTASSTILLSLFQRNLVGLRLTKFINWQRAATTAVRYISGAAYA